MLPRFIQTIVIVVIFCATVTNTSAQNQKAVIRTLLSDRDQEIKSVLAKAPLSDVEEEKLREIVNGLILFEEMGKTALGDYWAGLTGEQRNDFVDTFGAIVREQSLADLDPYRADITIDSVKVDGNVGHVSTVAVYKDVSTSVEYDLVLRSNEWWITDISLDGVSTAQGYARSFQSAIRKRGFDGLMKSLRKRLARITD